MKLLFLVDVDLFQFLCIPFSYKDVWRTPAWTMELADPLEGPGLNVIAQKILAVPTVNMVRQILNE